MIRILLFLIGLWLSDPVSSSVNSDSLRAAALSLSDVKDYEGAARLLKQLRKGATATDQLALGNAYLADNQRGKAKKAFQKAIDLGAKAEGYHGVGRVYQKMGAHGQMALVNFRRALGKDPTFAPAQYEIAQIYRTLRPLEAKVAYRAVIEIDARHADAYFQLGRLLTDEGRIPEARTAFIKQIEENPGHGFASLSLGRQLYEEGKKQDASMIFSALMDVGGEVETASFLEMALMSQDAKEFDTSQRLFEAYIKRLPEDRRPPFTDISYVASRVDLAALGEVPDDQKEAMRRRYWGRVDPTPLTRANERLVEHYRRVAFAINTFSEGESPFDERGRAFVRLGKPDHVSRSDDIAGEVDRSLLNARENFVSRMRLGVEVRPGLPTYPVGSDDRWEYWIYADMADGAELTFTSTFSDGKFRYADIPEIGSLASINEFLSLHGDNVVAEGSSSESSRYHPDFADLPIDFYYYSASFRGQRDKSRLEVYYGLPASDVARAAQGDGDDLIVFDRGIVLHDTTWTEVHRVRDQMVFRAPTAQQLSDDAFIPGVMPVDLPAGDYWMSLQIRDRPTGKSQVYKQRIHLDDYSPQDNLQISDIELAFYIGETDEEYGDFVKNGLKVIPMSSRSFTQRQNAFVYFEIYNLSRDSFGQSSYRVEYTVRSHTERSAPARILRGLGRILRVVEGEQEVKVSFEQTASGETGIAYVELDITEARPGGQLVKVKVTDMLSEVSAEKSITFSVDGY
jgi:GWxTD domain-containing protein